MGATAGISCLVPLLGITLVDGSPGIATPAYQLSAYQLMQEDYPQGVPLALALRIAADAARALARLHPRGMLHLHLSPMSIYLNGNAARMSRWPTWQ